MSLIPNLSNHKLIVPTAIPMLQFLTSWETENVSTTQVRSETEKSTFPKNRTFKVNSKVFYVHALIPVMFH